jgi:glycosyltransferase involved in cell wall biosynthesis
MTERAIRMSIVTPSLNQRDFIQEALESVRLQNYANTEHLVIDGGSTDGTVQYLESLSGKPGWEHLYWLSEPDKGQGDALNKGFRKASGEVIGWLNSDDLYRPGCFDKVISAFSKHPEVDLFYGDYTWIDEKGQLLQIRREIDFNAFVLLYHRTLCVPSTSSFFRRRIFEDNNFIDIDYHYIMDWEFFVRLVVREYRLQHLPALLADFRWQSNSKTCRHVDRECSEKDRIVARYAPSLRALPRGLDWACLRVLRALAATRYWGEKGLRGYYFKRWLSSLSAPL